MPPSMWLASGNRDEFERCRIGSLWPGLLDRRWGRRNGRHLFHLVRYRYGPCRRCDRRRHARSRLRGIELHDADDRTALPYLDPAANADRHWRRQSDAVDKCAVAGIEVDRIPRPGVPAQLSVTAGDHRISVFVEHDIALNGIPAQKHNFLFEALLSARILLCDAYFHCNTGNCLRRSRKNKKRKNNSLTLTPTDRKRPRSI